MVVARPFCLKASQYERQIGAFWRVCEEIQSQVCVFCANRISSDKERRSAGELLSKYDLSSLKSIFMAGERLDPPTLDWVESPDE